MSLSISVCVLPSKRLYSSSLDATYVNKCFTFRQSYQNEEGLIEIYQIQELYYIIGVIHHVPFNLHFGQCKCSSTKIYVLVYTSGMYYFKNKLSQKKKGYVENILIQRIFTCKQFGSLENLFFSKELVTEYRSILPFCLVVIE